MTWQQVVLIHMFADTVAFRAPMSGPRGVFAKQLDYRLTYDMVRYLGFIHDAADPA